ncbi:hypothetical protein MTR62_05655 [Novosphingobium sp. 1949]|uniref:Imm33-like domain-containing protein n=1 Tax=Novosphingobium organovorum TaxID=2930092 RepID=A0ABT0BB51_9SPHN|nr:hypothetical protein [Novosphingobium organovorum]MCJ2182184.1 hypothetical protein [Novosphingobium organovorum]
MIEAQQGICKRYGADFTPPEDSCVVGISDSALCGEMPLHGLRHPFEKGSTGWFIWSGDYSNADDFFKPVHLYHLQEDCPAALPYLALPPGWRFLIAPEYEDVWSDSSLLNI